MFLGGLYVIAYSHMFEDWLTEAYRLCLNVLRIVERILIQNILYLHVLGKV